MALQLASSLFLEQDVDEVKGQNLSQITDSGCPESDISGSPEASGPEFSESDDVSESEISSSERRASHTDVAGSSFWAHFLAGSQAAHFPSLPSVSYTPNAREFLECEINYQQGQDNLESSSVALQTAWTVLLACYTQATDVVFGRVVSRAPGNGESSIKSGVKHSIAPLRVVFDWSNTISELLDLVRGSLSNSRIFEDVGLDFIQQSSAEAELVCHFQNLLTVVTGYDETAVDPTPFPPLSTYGLSLLCQLKSTGTCLTAKFDPQVVSQAQVKRLTRQFSYILGQISIKSNSSQHIADIQIATPDDLAEIRAWNSVVPVTAEACVHDLIAERVQSQPSAPAVCSWDGDWTYAQLDHRATLLAQDLVGSGTPPDSSVLLFFEKSKWMPVAMLGVMKASCASVAVDVTMPEERLQSIVQEVGSTVAVASSSCENLARRLGATAVIVLKNEFADRSFDASLVELPKTTPKSKLYITFTSGSTGKPKGSVHTHQGWSSAIMHQREALGYNAECRIFDFASYAFDMAWSTFIHGLTAGACICIPSQKERTEKPASAMTRLKVNYVHFTPTVARLLPREAFANVKTIRLGGEASRAADIARLAGDAKIINIYAPSECAGAITYKVIDIAEGDPSIGTAIGANTWLVNPQNPSMLAAVGAIGELWLEGPLISNGYVNNSEATTASFIENPPWLVRDVSGRLYKTGDLVKYDTDGSLIYIGRSDKQVKIHGQRVELGDIEHSLEQTLSELHSVSTTYPQVVAEVVKLADTEIPVLVAFVHITSTGLEDIASLVSSAEFENRVADKLPSYMIPVAYIPRHEIPMTVTGKVFRRKLQSEVSAMTRNDLVKLCPRKTSMSDPTTKEEKLMRNLWSAVLKLEPSEVGANDHFFKLGGDSIAAIRLVQAAQNEGFAISYVDIFRCPLLRDMARVATSITASVLIPPFGLLKDMDIETARQQAALECNVDKESIQDIMPCSSLQEGMLAMTSQSSAGYMGHFEFQLRAGIDILRFKKAWERTVAQSSILRTRIVHMMNVGLVQVVLKDFLPIAWNVDSDNRAKQCPMGLGTPLLKQSIETDSSSECYKFIIDIHHTLFDGWSMPVVLDTLGKIYNNIEPDAETEYSAFIKSVIDIDLSKATRFWQHQFSDIEAVPFPFIEPGIETMQANRTFTHTIKDFRGVVGGFSLTTTVRAAWTVVSARYTFNRDVIFGAVSSGRQANVLGIESIRGPTIATMPIRVRIQWDQTSRDLFDNIQGQTLEMSPYEQFGLQNIQRMAGEEVKQACRFQTLLVVQPEQGQTTLGDIFVSSERASDTDLSAFSSYALMLEIEPHKDDLQVRLCFDSRVVDEALAKRLGRHFEHVLRQLCSSSDVLLSDIKINMPEDLHEIWAMNNRTVPDAVDSTINERFAEMVHKYPDAPAVCAWNGDLTYRELDDLSTRLAIRLLKLGTNKRGKYIPALFEKSKWMPVTCIGIFKAGHAVVAMDAGAPEERLRSIIDQVQPPLVLTSTKTRCLAERAAGAAVAVLAVDILDLDEDQVDERLQLPPVAPEDPACLQFTSGSTGVPKGVILTHRNFRTAMPAYFKELRINISTRIYCFASYAFDISWVNFIDAFGNGLCLCVPSEEDRRNDLIGSINRLKPDWAWLPNSLARTLRAKDIPSLRTLMVGGEPFQVNDYDYWYGDCGVISIYGPSEGTSINSVIDASPESLDYDIGRPVATNLWIVQEGGDHEPAPIGALGEMALEGPLLANGYYNNPQKTAEVFLQNPTWLSKGVDGMYGRKSTIYKTGDFMRINANGQMISKGRKDVQVKIRGQRIELGDIEHHARQLLPTRQQVVDVVMPQETRQKILVMYIPITDVAKAYAGEPNIHLRPATNDPAMLRLFAEPSESFREVTARLSEQLKQVLPTYMVPDLYVPVTEIPKSQTGKVDRKVTRAYGHLFTQQQLVALGASTTAIQEPENEMERELCGIWGSVLGFDSASFGTNSGFYQAGGDSIKIMSLARIMEQRFGVKFKVALLGRQDATIRKLAEMISGKQDTVTGTSFNIDAEEKIWQQRLTEACPNVQPVREVMAGYKHKVFLTGANGYLGTQILHKLVEDAQYEKIYVLVRSQKDATGMQRIKEAAQALKWWTEESAAKIEVWEGDIGKDKLGLSQSNWSLLANEVDTIIHNAAVVNWSVDYEALKQPNIVSTFDLLKLAAESSVAINFVFISGGLKINQDDEATFSMRLNESDGYCQTKYIAERLTLVTSDRARAAGHTGKTFSVVKPGLIIGNSDHGVSNADDFTWRLVSSAVDFRAYPQDHPASYMYLGEGSYIADTVLQQIAHGSSQIKPFIDIGRGMPVQRFWDIIQHELEMELQAVEWERWQQMAQHALDTDGESHRLWPVQGFLGKTGHTRMSSISDVDVELEKSVARCVRYFVDVGFIAGRPKDPNAGCQIFTRTRPGNRQ